MIPYPPGHDNKARPLKLIGAGGQGEKLIPILDIDTGRKKGTRLHIPEVGVERLWILTKLLGECGRVFLRKIGADHLVSSEFVDRIEIDPVSYTHLDVYKRQAMTSHP